MVDVLYKYTSEHPTDVVLQKWITDLSEATRYARAVSRINLIVLVHVNSRKMWIIFRAPTRVTNSVTNYELVTAGGFLC